MTSMSAIVTEHYVNKQTTEKRYFKNKCTVIAVIVEVSVSRVTSIAVVKINKMAEGGSPRQGVNKVGCFADFLQQ